MAKTLKRKEMSRAERIELAVEEIRSGGAPSISEAARRHKLIPSTVSRRYRGIHSSRRAGFAHLQALSEPAERTLVDWCVLLGLMGMPCAKEDLTARATKLARPGHILGRNWYRGFLERHKERLSFKFAYELDPKRASGFNYPTVSAHFQTFSKMMQDYNIPVAHLYNMDEKGLQLGGGRSTSRRKYAFQWRQKLQYKIKHNSLELVTVIECVSGDGVALKPSFVHQPGYVSHWWEDERVGCCVASPNGWTSDEICEQWFIKYFIPASAERRVSDAPIVLLLDGHGSHITHRIRTLAYKHGIFIFCLPPKTTHRLQPLDINIFNWVQAEWKRTCEESAQRGEPVNKELVVSKYMEARAVAITAKRITEAWRRSGHHPFNPDIFTAEDYAPSMSTSIKTHLPSSFPVPISSHSSADAANLESAPVNVEASDHPHVDPSFAIIETEPIGSNSNAESEPLAAPAPASPLSHAPAETANPSCSPASNRSSPSPSLPAISFTPAPVYRQHVGDWRGLPLKQQVSVLESNTERLWGLYTQCWSNLEASNAHAILLAHENEQQRRQIQALGAPKRSREERAIAMKVQKHSLLTGPETRQQHDKEVAELEAKQAEETRKLQEKEAHTREVDARRSRMVVDGTHEFKGTLNSFKTANLEQLGDLAASLALPVAGLKKAELLASILACFESCPELKAAPRYAALFRVRRSVREND